MYVCICQAVTTEQICKAVAAGARSVSHLAEGLGVAVNCGACLEAAHTLVESLSQAADSAEAKVPRQATAA